MITHKPQPIDAAPTSKWLYEDASLRLELKARSQDQTGAFYTGRKFPPNLFEFLSEFAPDLSSYRDPDGEVTKAWKPRGLPVTYLIDPAGVVRYQALGGLPWDTGPHRRFLGQLNAP